MRSVVILACALVCILFALLSIASLRAKLSHAALVEAGRAGSANSNLLEFQVRGEDKLGIRGGAAQRQELLSSSEQATAKLFAPAAAFGRRAALLMNLASQSRDSAQRIALLCESLSLLGSGIEKQPYNSRLLINWANIRQTLGTHHCPQEFTQGDYDTALQLALDAHGNDYQVNFAAAMIYEWGQEFEKVQRLFRKLLTFGVGLSSERKNHIFSKIRDEQALSEILPARFPQIVEFTNYLEQTSSGRRLLKSLSPSLGQAHKQAIHESINEFEYEKIPYNVHIVRMKSLERARVSNSVRQILDLELARLLEKRAQTQLSEFFRERAGLSELMLARAALASDTRPAKTCLADWNPQGRVAFDEFYRSLGFYMARGQTLKMMVLESDLQAPDVAPSAIRVWSSDDNQHWTERAEDLSVKKYVFDERTIFAIRINSPGARYWKINFNSSARGRKFSNDLARLVRAFGYSEFKDR